MNIIADSTTVTRPATAAAPEGQRTASGEPLVLDWLQVTTCASPLWFLTPSAAGARLFRKRGWSGLTEALAPWANAHGIDLDAARLVARLPAPGEGSRGAATPLARPVEPDWSPVVVDDAGCTLSASFEVPFDLAIFVGHFATVPIVPGAMLLGWMADLARQHGGWRHGAVHASAMKFRRIVQPGPRYAAQMRWRADGSRLDFQIGSIHGLHASGGLLAAGHGSGAPANPA